MLVLGINTAGDVCEAALTRDGAVVSAVSETMAQGHDARLAPIVEQLMQQARCTFDELDRLAVVVGPGSFTGVRVGVAFARGLSLAARTPTPAVAVTSLEALDGLPGQGRVLGVLPAKRRPPEQTWWAQILEHGQGASEPVEASAEDLRQLVRSVDAMCGGVGGIPDPCVPRIFAAPTAGAAALSAERRAGPFSQPRPVYVRAPDATPMARP